MKKTILMFAAAGLMLATPSCKKGENDPFLSLSSRKARVAGEWDVTGYEFMSNNVESDGDSQSSTGSLSNNVITFTNSSTSGGTTVTNTNTVTVNEFSYTFEKDGTWSSTQNTTSVNVQSDYPITGFTTTSTTVETNSYTGNWSFVGKVKDAYKNKERIVLNTLTSSGSDQTTTVVSDDSGTLADQTSVGDLFQGNYNYHSGEVQETWEIDQLKGKEMIVKMMETNSGTYSITPDGGATTSFTNDDYTSETTITLTAK
jgi:hypothetical protein